MGLDEANLDVTDWLRDHNMDNDQGRLRLAQRIRKQIHQKTKMTCSCGIGCNKMLAKILSDINKPNGQTFLEFNDQAVSEFMEKLPIRKVPGVGKINEQILSGMGIKMCRDTLKNGAEIQINFTSNACDFLVKSALGIAKNVHDDHGIKKGVHCSKSVHLISEHQQFEQEIATLCRELSDRAKAQGLSARTIIIEFKNDKFKNKQKSHTSRFFMAEYDDFLRVALRLLDEAWPVGPCRRLSVNLANLKDKNGNFSESAHTTMIRHTGGSSKLGGLTRE